ncbi:MAG: hypothetical protein O2782_00095 [bacterium]|nr:hypothetical protein [bacterium]
MLEESAVLLTLTARELRLILGWRETGAFFPDEDRVLRKLRRALEDSRVPSLSRLQIQIVHGWAEEALSGPYGGGEVTNPDEAGVLHKVREALGYND